MGVSYNGSTGDSKPSRWGSIPHTPANTEYNMNKQIPSNFIDVNRVLQNSHWKTIILKCELCGFKLIRKVGGDMDD